MSPEECARALAALGSEREGDRALVRRLAAEAPLRYGTWRYVKRLYKEVEAAAPPELLGTLIGRFDRALLDTEAAATASGSPKLYGTHLVIREDRGYLATYQAFQVLDLSDPTDPTVLGTMALGECARVAVSGDRAFVHVEGGYGRPGRVEVVDVSDPARLRSLGSAEVYEFQGMAVLGPYLVVAEGEGRRGRHLRVLDASDPGRHPTPVAAVEMAEVGGVAVVGHLAYVRTYSRRAVPGRLHVFDLSDPTHPAPLGAWRAPETKLLVGDTLLPGPSASRRLLVVDLNVLPWQSPDTPQPAEDSPPGLIGRITGMFRKAASDVAAAAVGATEPEAPGTMLELDERPLVVAVHGEHAYVLGQEQEAGISVISLRGEVRVVGRVPLEYIGYDQVPFAASGDRLLMQSWTGTPQVFLLSEPAHPVELGAAPSTETFGYMRRRGRRRLRELAETDPTRFAEVAYHTLVTAGAGRDAVDPRRQWTSIDLLYGGSERYEELMHGRRGYRARYTGTRRRTREERCPAAWDARPELAAALYGRADLPWQVHETMWKVLRANRTPLPALSSAHLVAFLRSPSPLLRREAVRAVAAAIEAGKIPEPEAAARTFFNAPGGVRRRLSARLEARAGSPKWARPFTLVLLEALAESLTPERVSRRAAGAARLLGGAFAPFLVAERLFPLAERLVRSGDPELGRVALAGFRTVTGSDLPAWLPFWAALPEALRAPAWEALVFSLRRTPPTLSETLALVAVPSGAPDPAAWELLLAAELPAGIVVPVWEALLERFYYAASLAAAVSSPAAMTLLGRSRIAMQPLVERLVTDPILAGVLSAAALEALAGSAAAEALVRMTVSFPEGRWPELREALLRGLSAPGRLAAFWQAIPAVLDLPGAARLVEDPVLSSVYLMVPDPEMLEVKEPLLEPLLVQWLERHGASLAPGSPGLLAAATHPLPAVRERGLALAAAQPLTVPFALRLLESGVPASMALAREHLEVRLSGPEALPVLLALCNSPERAVRALGRELLQARWEKLPQADVVSALAEHGDPEMNRFLAERLGDLPEAPPGPVAEFERGVLRAPNRGRRAKEAVKAHLDRAPEGDPALLLEIARSGTPRDAEWALGQLARLALAGETVEGVSLEGVAGG